MATKPSEPAAPRAKARSRIAKARPGEEKIGEFDSVSFHRRFQRTLFRETVTSPLLWVLRGIFVDAEGLGKTASPDGPVETVLKRHGFDPLNLPREFNDHRAALFQEFCEEALLARDHEFFRSVADLMQKSLYLQDKDDWPRRLLIAYFLVAKTMPAPTKKAVRERTKRDWAIELLQKQPGGAREPTEAQIARELARMPAIHWTEVFKRAGLGEIPEEKRGRPPKKR
jgi:hypothetical protein